MTVDAPDIQVTAFWTLSGPTADFWTVEDPIRGSLDDYGLAGDLETDITSLVRPGITITRGRNRQTDNMSTGTCHIVLKNPARILDPFNAAGPYFGNIVPGKRFTVRVGGVARFTGKSTDFDFGFDRNASPTATVPLEDSLGVLARAELDAFTSTAGSASTQIHEALNRPEIVFGGNRDITGGVSTLAAQTVAQGTNLLAYASKIAQSDLGRIFASREDVLTFRDRASTIPDGSDAFVSFADDGSGIKFTDPTLAYGQDVLFTRTIVSRVGGSTEIADDVGQQLIFGQLSTRDIYTGLFLDSDGQSSDMADFLLATYSDPELRIGSITVNLMACRDAAELAQVLALDIGSAIHVTYTPSSTGAAIDRYCVVEGMREAINRKGDYKITFMLGDVLQFGVWTVEDALLGAPDESPIAF